MSTKRRRAVIYIRISRTTEESVSLERQERALRAVCELEDWEVVEVIADDGESGRKDRAEAIRALDMLRSGTADTLLTWKFDRWSRAGLPAVAALIEALDARRGLLFVAKEDGLRSDSSLWPILASILAEVARMEAQNTADRISAMRAEVLSKTAREDQRYLGGKPPFGYRIIPNPHGPGKALAHDEYEATIVRDVAARFIAGERLSDVTVWLDAQGVPTAASPARRARQAGAPTDGLDRGKWRVTTVRNLWRSETLVGRTTKREPVLDAHGEPILDADGNPRLEVHVVTDKLGLPVTRWEPIIDAATYEGLRDVFLSPGRVQPRRTKSWLTGLVRCASCGHKAYVQARQRREHVEELFRCSHAGNPLTPCPAPSVVELRKLEAYVEAAFLDVAGAKPELMRQAVADPVAEAELREVAVVIDDITKALARDGADVAALIGRLTTLKDRRRELLSESSAVTVKLVPTGRTLGDMWAEREGNNDARRELLAEVIERVEVSPIGPAGNRTPIDDARVYLAWNRDRVPVLDLDGASNGPLR